MDPPTEEKSPAPGESISRWAWADALRPRRPQSVKASVLILLSVGLVPALAGMAWHLEQQRVQALQQAYSRAELLNNGISANLGRILTDAKAVMSAIAARPKVAAMSSEDCDPVFRDFGNVYPNYTLVVLIRVDGETLCPGFGDRKPSAEEMKQHPVFRAGVARHGFYAGDAVVAPVTDNWVAPLMYPVADGAGHLRGVLVLPLDLEKLATQLFASLPQGDFVAVVDNSDRVLLRNSQLPQHIGEPLVGPFARLLAELRTEKLAGAADGPVVRRFATRTFDGVSRLYFARSLPMSDWWVVTGMPEKETLQDYVMLRNRSLAAMALVLALAALIGWRVARRVIGPLNELALTAKSIAAGNDAYRARESGPAELGVVAREFNRMVDAQRTAQQQLRENEQRYRTLFNAAPVPSVILSVPERRIRDLNEAACQFYGIRREEALGRVPEELGVGPLEEDKRRFYDELAAQGRVRGIAGHVRVRSGEWREAVFNADLIQYAGQQCLLTMSLDLTSLRQAERSREELAAARAADRAKTEFLSHMSHELRTPLNAVLGFSQILQMDQRLPADVQGRVGHILTAGKHLLSLVEELLDLARIESGNLALTLEPVHLPALLQECLTLCQPLANGRNVVLSGAVDCAGPRRLADLWVRAHPMRLRQVLMNLLSNAIKYNRPGGRVSVKVEQDQGGVAEAPVRLTVIDTGRGISEQQMTRLFLPFSRLGAESGTVEGHGIGLAISRRLAQAMDGDITVRSSPGTGSEFTLHLVACAGPPGQAVETRVAQSAPEATPVAREGNLPPGLRVLSVEDNAVNQLLVQAVFARRPNLALATAQDGTTALAAARSQRPDLVLIDLNLPDMDGFELLKRLRSEPATAAVPCWAVTADAMRETMDKVRAAGFDAYISKPFAAEEFLSRLDQWASVITSRPRS